MSVAPPVSYDRQGAIAVLTINSPPVNALSQPVRSGLLEGLSRAEADDSVTACVLLGSGRCFVAGADINEFGKPPAAPYLPDVCARFEASHLTVIAALHGVCLGGGLEVALAAHHRVAHPATQIGFPEVRLGLIPGAGGTQRLPRLIGVEAAIECVTTGRALSGARAAALGLVDRIDPAAPRTAGLDFAQEVLRQAAPRYPVCEKPAPAAVDWDAAERTVSSRARGQRAPVLAVEAIRASVERPFHEGMAEERRIFLDLLASDQRKAMVHLFFAERAVARLPELEGLTPRGIGSLGVVGGGTMGAGIATSALLSGLPVALLETSIAAAETARDRIAENLEQATRLGKLTSADYEIALSQKLQVTTAFQALASVDLVIEAVFEDLAVKKSVFERLDAVCRTGTVLATNTSYLDVNELATATGRPEDVIGLHFFSPAHVMKLLEIVVADQTAPEVVKTAFDFAKRLGKVAVRAGVCDGFIGNRIQQTYRVAADDMVLAGASPAQVDGALTGFGFAMGPYAVADLAGLDIRWANRKRLAATQDPRLRTAGFPDKLCEAGHFGRKSGRGYYDYSADVPLPNAKALELIAAERSDLKIPQQSFTPDQIVSRLMAAMVNEAAKVIEEGIARRPLDVDVVLVSGYGFPRHQGGPCQWADLHGLRALLSEIEGYAQEDAFFWRPAPLLQRLVERGQHFDDLNATG